MTQRTLVVAGAGPGLGAAVARRFGREGYRVALISRSPQTFGPIVEALAAKGIEAVGFPADLTDDASTRAAFAAIRKRFGRVDVLEYSPIVNTMDKGPVGATVMTADMLKSIMPVLAYGAVTCVNEVLDEMLARKEGSIIITTAGAAGMPVPSHAAIGAAMSVARMYALALNAATKTSGVFVGTISLAVDLVPGSPVGDPDQVADTYYRMHLERDVPEIKIVDPELMGVLGKRLESIQAKVSGQDG